MRTERYTEIENRMDEIYKGDSYTEPVNLGECFIVELMDSKGVFFTGAIPISLVKDRDEAVNYFTFRMGMTDELKLDCEDNYNVSRGFVTWSGGGIRVEGGNYKDERGEF